jgi:hypothetical protein
MALSDSTRDLYKELQKRAKTVRRLRPGRDGWQRDTEGQVSLDSPRRAGGLRAKKRWRIPPKVRPYLPYVAAFLIILAPLLHNPPRNNQVPPYLVGVWETKAPGYEDRFLMFAKRNVAFGTGEFEGESYLVAEAEARPLDGSPQDVADKDRKMEVLVRYMKPDKLEYSLAFYYDPLPDPTITFKNQEHLRWTRKKGPKL